MADWAGLLETALGLVFAVAMLASFVWPFLRMGRSARTSASASAPTSAGDGKAWAAYRGVARWSADPRRAFRAATAEIVRQQAFGPDGGMAVGEPASVHVHARNAHGAFFFVIAREDGSVFVKPMSPAAAAAVLGGDRETPAAGR